MQQGPWCVLFLVVAVVPAAGQVDPARAEQYFMEAQMLCERDGGRLWGVSLCGPMVIADGATGTIGGALISADGETVSLPAPVVVDATTLKGDGWTATVGPGWTVQPGPRPGSFRVVRQ